MRKVKDILFFLKKRERWGFRRISRLGQWRFAVFNSTITITDFFNPCNDIAGENTGNIVANERKSSEDFCVDALLPVQVPLHSQQQLQGNRESLQGNRELQLQ